MLLALTACNLPFLSPAATSTPVDTATFTPEPASPTPVPSNTPAAPTNTSTPIASNTPTPLPPTATLVLPTLPLPTAIPTNTRIPTQQVVRPYSNARFDGTFADGTLILRVSDNSNMVIPKEVRVRNASCKEGRALSDTINFEPPPSYAITDAKFDINYLDYVFISGQFFSSTSAQGMIRLILQYPGGGRCTIGPTAWRASATVP
ncbi:MAG: hypothetical protein A2Z16_04030 [Chloroflexi bacterium RBG_16_54_18]|nr:MAG: hypothetical protein A2Z16_04030 [Chloroflexi bacterium RBG_16_54_18]